jgi:hypothetical protein
MTKSHSAIIKPVEENEDSTAQDKVTFVGYLFPSRIVIGS